jgi:hypothetical protein
MSSAYSFPWAIIFCPKLKVTVIRYHAFFILSELVETSNDQKNVNLVASFGLRLVYIAYIFTFFFLLYSFRVLSKVLFKSWSLLTLYLHRYYM